jgi:hypothetical protein
MMTHGISRTRGGDRARDFFWYISNDKLIIQKIVRNKESWISEGRSHIFTQSEIIDSLYWLLEKFGNGNFPLANNVERLGNKTERDGFGVALYTLRANTFFAQGSSYLGVVMECFGVLAFVRPPNRITWKFTESHLDCASITMRINECFELARRLG